MMSDPDLSVRRYAGDVSPKDAWDILERDPAAQIVDVRTAAEWAFVGTPDLGALGRQPLFVEWHSFPDPRPDPAFVSRTSEKLRAAGAGPETPVLFLCRSGGRSRAAAAAMAAAGVGNALNVMSGFEGDPDAQGHRGTTSGWKADGLPWRQS